MIERGLQHPFFIMSRQERIVADGSAYKNLNQYTLFINYEIK